ncbi:MAG: hypothetical protein AAB447_00240 [Patescibacteria group bacterium]
MASNLTFLCDRCGSYSVCRETFVAFLTTDEIEKMEELQIDPSVVEIRIRFHNGICPQCGEAATTTRTFEVVRKK